MEMISISKACKMLGVSQQTLRTYGSKGIVSPVTTLGGHRRYLLKDIQALQGFAPAEPTTLTTRACCYCRVSSNDQKQHGDLERQKLRVLEYCSSQGWVAEHILTEVCSGMKAKRPKLDKLYELVSSKKVDVVVVEHKDRLARFMFDVFSVFFGSHGVKIVCVEADLPKSFESELVADIMSLMTSFTATLHSRRKRQSKEYRKRLEQGGVVV